MITKDAVEGYEFLLPPLPEQQAIAEVLSSLDDKIDLLHRNNKTLEEVMNTFMRQWFLAEAEGEYKTTLKIGDCLKSVSTTHKFPSTEVVFLNTSDILLGRVLVHTTTPVKTLPGQAKKAIEKGDILFSEIRPANGRWAFVDFESTNYVVSTKLMVLRGTGKVSTELLYFYLTHKQTVDYLQMLAESRSGTFPQITYDQLSDLEIHLPNEESLIMASTIAKDTLQQLSRNNKQIVTLQNLRDTLLPKLMSGQVSVNIN
jgi:type I restriction enzyme S subunit